MSPALPILNISAYRFVRISDLHGLRNRLLNAASGGGLKGTVLIAEEGINLFLAGTPGAIGGFLRELRTDSRFADIEAKESWSGTQPFGKLLVKIKREIIRMNHPAIRPGEGRAPAVDALTLRRWLDAGHDDEGRPVVTLDTRNAFEVDLGTFDGAVDWRIGKFSDFPRAVQAHAGNLVGKTVVSFCTGGIRCEKAAIVLREAGLTHVWQLEGGILKYFEQAGGAHYRGRCFVFDERQALDPGLAPHPGPWRLN